MIIMLLVKAILVASCMRLSLGAQYASVKYYADTACKVDAFGVAVRPTRCIHTASGSAWVTCSSSQGLLVSEFSTNDCMGESNNTIIVTPTVDSGCALGSFANSSYFQVPQFGYEINCDDDENWAENENDYIISRGTFTLQANSAIDFTRDRCEQNNATTEMDYCFLNSNVDYCLPTDNGDGSLCDDYSTLYAYSDNCQEDYPSSGFSYQYQTKTYSGKMLKFGSTDCQSGSQGYSVPYKECLGCNSFEELNGSGDDGARELPAWAIVLIVFASLFCCACMIGVLGLLIFGTAQVIACICCKRADPTPNTQLAHQQHSQSTASPVHTAAYPPPYSYGGSPAPAHTATAVPMTAAAPAYGMELLSIQVPAEAKPGCILQAIKSNGQQIQFEVPPGTIPGSIIQIQA